MKGLVGFFTRIAQQSDLLSELASTVLRPGELSVTSPAVSAYGLGQWITRRAGPSRQLSMDGGASLFDDPIPLERSTPLLQIERKRHTTLRLCMQGADGALPGLQLWDGRV